MFEEVSKDKEKFATFTNNFGRYIKVGVIEDRDNKDALLKIASFSTCWSTIDSVTWYAPVAMSASLATALRASYRATTALGEG